MDLGVLYVKTHHTVYRYDHSVYVCGHTVYVYGHTVYLNADVTKRERNKKEIINLGLESKLRA